MIIIDKREKSNIPQLLSKRCPTEWDTLDVGDYVMVGPETSVCATLKDAGDYIGSIESDHLSDELIQISANYKIAVVIVHGNIDKALMHRGMRRQTLFNYMAGIITRTSPYGLKTTPSFVNFFTPGIDGWKKDPWDKSVYDAVELLKTLHDITVTDNIARKPSTIKYKVPPNKQQLYAIQYLFKPTGVIGEVRATEIQKKFKTIKAISNADVEDFQKIDGIGEKIAKEMYNLLNYEVN